MATPDFVNLQSPSTLTVQAGALTELTFGQIFEAGLTESAGADPTIVAQLGYGPLGSDPETDTSWTWIDATFNGQVGDNDEYRASFTAPLTAGQYAYTCRFAIDDGVNPLTFTYGDLDGNGENAGQSFDPDQLGTLTVTPPPVTIDFSDSPGGLKFDFDGSGDPVNDSAATRISLAFNGAGGGVRVEGLDSASNQQFLDFASILEATGTAEADVTHAIGTSGNDQFDIAGAYSTLTLEGREGVDLFSINSASGATILGGDQPDTVLLTGVNQIRYDGGTSNFVPFNEGDSLVFDDAVGHTFTISGSADTDGFWSADNTSAAGDSSISLRNVEKFILRNDANDANDTISITGDYTTGLDTSLTISAGGGVNTITVESSGYVIVDDVFGPTTNSDTILLTGGSSFVQAFGGNDRIDTGESGATNLDFDTISYGIESIIGNPQGLTVDLRVRDSQGYATIAITNSDNSTQTDLVKNFEELWATVGNDSITANDGPLDGQGLSVTGYAGADSLIGAAGANRFDGGSGNDTLDGGAGDDTLWGGLNNFAFHLDTSDNDILTGGADNDLIFGDDGQNGPPLFAGNIDTALFSGNWADYDIVTNNSVGFAGFQLTHARNTGTTNDGQDRVFQVEQFQFADRTLSAADLLTGGGDTTPPTITSAGTAPAIAENSGAGQVVYTVTATDSAATGGPSNPLSYSLGTGGDASAFTINGSSGAVTLTGNPDFETKASYSFTVVATDAAGNASQQTVTLGITNVDEGAPTITSGATATAIAENSGAGQVVYTVTSTDTDVVSGTTTYSLGTGGDASAFTINSSSGAVTLTGNPNYEVKSSYSFTVVATDAAGNASQQTVTLGITNVDEVAPTITSGATATAIAENSGAGQVVYTVTSTDTDVVSGTTTYSLGTGGDASAFTINGSSGAVTLTGNPDFETKASYSFTVVATDAAGNAASQLVSLAITDLNEGTPTTTATITNVRETTTNSPSSTSLTLSGTLSAALVADEVVRLYDGPNPLNNANLVVSGTTWSYSISPTTAGNHTFTAEVANATSQSAPSSVSVLAGTTGNNNGGTALTGTSAGEYIFGFAGTDTINGFAGSDTIMGGAGSDTILLTTTSADLNNATDARIRNVETVSAAGAATTVTIDLRNQSESLVISGSGNADTITGGSGVDAISGSGGADILTGGAGNDFLTGGAGIDNLNGGAGGDTLIGGDGSDTIDVGVVNDNVQDRVQFFNTSEFGDSVSNFNTTEINGKVDLVEFGGSLRSAFDDIGANRTFAWVTGNGSDGGNTTANLKFTGEALYLAGIGGEGVSDEGLLSATTVATEFNAEFAITASSGQDALLVVNATDSNNFAVYSYLENGSVTEIQVTELTLIGGFNSNGDVGTGQFGLI